MAVTTARRRPKNPEGRMPLRSHLAELRRRLLICALAIGLGAVAGWFLYDPVLQHLREPFDRINAEAGRDAAINFGDVMGSLNLKIKLSVYIGLVAASPVWLFQIWGFITPGLTRKERRYGLGFVAAGVPLFLGGVTVAWLWIPRAVEVLTEFTPVGAKNFVDAGQYFSFVTRLILAFGIAFVLPLLLVVLNFAGLVTGAAMGKQWRIAVFIAFLFAAVMSPSPDPGGMLAMAVPMTVLYALAVGVSLLNDRRRRRRDEAALAALGDDEAAPLDSAEPVGPAGDFAPPSRLDDDAT
jgi:sec-independent protein translocase protein TatC